MRLAPGTLLVTAALVGCRNQQAMTNPFLTPDRVPPPSTRIIAPGTAQPYYPGDPLPGAAVAPPAVTTPAAPPATAYPGGAYPPSTTPLTTPPGGWGAYPPQALAAPASSPAAAVQPATAEIPMGPASPSDAVRMPGDALPLRFPAPQPQSFGPSAEPITPTPASPPAARMPIQSILPLSGAQPVPPAPAGSFPPNAGAQSPQQLQIREIAPAEYLAPQPAPPASTIPARDGFRPQSAEPRDDSSPAQGFRPPEIRKTAVAADGSSANQYGIGDNYQWLRGQLEYWPAAGQWSLRYLPVDGQADSLGGRVLIDNPQVLANLQPGEFVMVRGQLFNKPTDAGLATPAYRVSVVQRQRL
jgi:hypothetical protein